MIGWRGEPGKKDAPQHNNMGKILLSLLKLLEIPYEIIPKNNEKTLTIVKKAKDYMKKNNRPFALIVKKGIFEKRYSEKNHSKRMSREEALEIVMKYLDDRDIIVSTTGKLSRELFEYRLKNKDSFDKDFYNIGAMGCAQSIALGIALQKKEKNIFVFDGDGAVLMQMGSIATIGHYSPRNFYHIIFDNNAHDSTGGQPTCSDTVDFSKIAESCNYKYIKTVINKIDLDKVIKNMKNNKGPALLVIKIKKGSRVDLKRPNKLPIEYKKYFMRQLVS
jgi:phosphonopyruvate decarboxylase